MKFKKFISSGLILGLFISTSSSFAGTLSEGGRYETFEGDNIEVHDILEEEIVDIDIEGNTLVNLMPLTTPKAMNADFSNTGEVYRATRNEEESPYLQFSMGVFGSSN